MLGARLKSIRMEVKKFRVEAKSVRVKAIKSVRIEAKKKISLGDNVFLDCLWTVLT